VCFCNRNCFVRVTENESNITYAKMMIENRINNCIIIVSRTQLTITKIERVGNLISQ
jgi:hypothetical protein